MKKLDIKVVAEKDTTFFMETVVTDKNEKGKIQRYNKDNIEDSESETPQSNETKKRYGKKYPNESKW